MSPLAVVAYKPDRAGAAQEQGGLQRRDRDGPVLTVTVNPAIDQTLWIPGFRTGQVNRVEREATRPGGKGINVAARLRLLGVDVTATGVLGAANASAFEIFLAERDIADRLVRRPGTTRTGIKVVDRDGSDTTDINFPGETPDAEVLAELGSRVAELARRSSWVVLSGSLPPGVPTDLYRRLTEAAHDAGARVALDTSGEPLALAIAAGPDLVKPNREELAELLGRPLTVVSEVCSAATELREGGVATVIVSLGADGALFLDADATIRAESVPVTVRSTVGAGDAMVAGTIAGLLRGLPLDRVAALATASSADAIRQQRDDAGDTGADERITALADRVVVDRLRGAADTTEPHPDHTAGDTDDTDATSTRGTA